MPTQTAILAPRPVRHLARADAEEGRGAQEAIVRQSGREDGAGRGGGAARRRPARRPFTFVLDEQLVERARREVGEGDVVRSIEAALAAALDYQLWVREVSTGERGVLS